MMAIHKHLSVFLIRGVEWALSDIRCSTCVIVFLTVRDLSPTYLCVQQGPSNNVGNPEEETEIARVESEV